jgi:glycine oxidase
VSDVLILGAGIIGCAVADELTRRGARVTVIDPRGIGRGASQASAGMLAPYNEGRHDPAMLALGARSLGLFDDLVARLRDNGHVVGYTRTGSIDVALDEDAAAALRATAAELTAHEIDCEWIEGPDLVDREPALNGAVIGGLRVAPHGAVAVGQLVEACWQSSESRGARRLLAAATGIAAGHGTARVHTTTGDEEARHVVLAAGSWAGQVAVPGVSALPVRPVRGQLLVLGWRGIPLTHTIWGPGCYAVPWEDGTVLVGATVEEAGFDEVATVDGIAALAAAMRRIAPHSASAVFGGARVGLRPGTPDDRPIIGRSGVVEGLVYATGHYRNGALLAPFTAKAVADLIEGRAADPVLAPCAPGRFGEY